MVRLLGAELVIIAAELVIIAAELVRGFCRRL